MDDLLKDLLKTYIPLIISLTALETIALVNVFLFLSKTLHLSIVGLIIMLILAFSYLMFVTMLRVYIEDSELAQKNTSIATFILIITDIIVFAATLYMFMIIK